MSLSWVLLASDPDHEFQDPWILTIVSFSYVNTENWRAKVTIDTNGKIVISLHLVTEARRHELLQLQVPLL